MVARRSKACGCCFYFPCFCRPAHDLPFRSEILHIPDEFVIALAAAGIFFFGRCFQRKAIIFIRLFFPPCSEAFGGGTLLAVGFSAHGFEKRGDGVRRYQAFFCAGLFLGVKGILSVFFMMILSAAFSVWFCSMKKLTLSSRIPFGPFICGAMAIYLCFFQFIHTFLNWYMSLFL